MEDDMALRPWNYDPHFHSSVMEIRKADEMDLQYFISECERCGRKESESWYIENRITNGMSGDYHVCCKACCDLLGGESQPTSRAVDEGDSAALKHEQTPEVDSDLWLDF